MTVKRKILYVVIAVFIGIQFIQQPRNKSDKELSTDIQKLYPMPDSVRAVLQTSCFNCHSNNTRYPWYSIIQPGGWWMSSHIKKGKNQLNFSDFGSYSKRRQLSKLQSIINVVKDGTMPLQSYTLIHTDAKLNDAQKALITNWASGMKDSLSTNNE
ncbi:MAG: heme-binding domain-containing protein [Ferruginibacter sp.]